MRTTQDINVLFISYDGLTDPLGQSQIIPYVLALQARGYRFTILSCEKKEPFMKRGERINELLSAHGVKWHHTFFHRRPLLLSKAYDQLLLLIRSIFLQRKNRYQIIHCRSYVAVGIGLQLKRYFKTAVLFDMRGFWVDERYDGGIWNPQSLLYRLLYRYYKSKERKYVRNADAIATLTDASVEVIKSWVPDRSLSLFVIPCAADFKHFTYVRNEDRALAKLKLGIQPDRLVISYLGSIGGWYLEGEMLDFYKVMKRSYPHVHFLFITNSAESAILRLIEKKGIADEDVTIVSASRVEVPVLLKASDLSIFFIKKAFSKIASSPTKLAELFACGIPVICNSGVGDVSEIVHSLGGGHVIDVFNDKAYQEAVEQVDRLLRIDSEALSKKAFSYFDLSNAISVYDTIYQRLRLANEN